MGGEFEKIGAGCFWSRFKQALSTLCRFGYETIEDPGLASDVRIEPVGIDG